MSHVKVNNGLKSYEASLFFEEVCTAWFALAGKKKMNLKINIHRSVDRKILIPHECGNRCYLPRLFFFFFLVTLCFSGSASVLVLN